MHGEEFDPEVAETVEKNVYMDDLMKSLDQIERTNYVRIVEERMLQINKMD